jgi:hypothetical protein
MAKPVRVKTKGLKELRKNTKAFKEKFRKNGQKVIVTFAERVKSRAIPKAPSREGNLRRSAHLSTKLVVDNGITFKGEDAGDLEGARSAIIASEKSRIATREKANKILGIIGFSAFYALPTHENPQAGAAFKGDRKDVPYTRGKRKGKKKLARDVHSYVGGYKFLENALQETKKQLPRIALAIMKIK